MSSSGARSTDSTDGKDVEAICVRSEVPSTLTQGSKLVVHARGLQNREPGFESRLPCSLPVFMVGPGAQEIRWRQSELHLSPR